MSTANQDEPCLVYVTAPDKETALELSRALLEQKLIACANILGPTISIFVWEGKTEEEAEMGMILKTVQSRLDAVTAAVTRLHPYHCPCVVALPVTGGSTPFLQWIGDQVRPQG